MTPEHPLRYLVLGGTSGIGLALVQQLSAAGARVLATGRDRARLDGGLPELPGVQWEALEDAADFDAVDALVKAQMGADGGLQGAVNCAGSILLRPAHLTTAAQFEETLRQNLFSAFSLVRAAGRHMAAHGGSVVLFSTAAVRLGLASHEAIAAAKGGVEGLVRSAAATYAARNLRFNAVAPGLVDTPMAARIVGNEAGRTASEGLHALGRLGTADEVARLAAFLLDPQQSWMTGQILGIDGGLGSVRSR
jgi:NAD(P)-dependent dehydrogenase (short-subunit alcohol dehydrogenase family)